MSGCAPTPVVERVERRCVPEDRGYTTACSIFTGALNDGYAVVWIGSRTDQSARVVSAHRVVWEHFNGPVPDGLELDHLCRQRACCNPEHLEAVTKSENIRRTWIHRKRRNAA